mmetsp:Transcript_94654/g.291836  ORF Transcript_94654/g.291836 Transcript_94654/m.291836 type:complete len:210 (-) Transcript_94654:359-988(-)
MEKANLGGDQGRHDPVDVAQLPVREGRRLSVVVWQNRKAQRPLLVALDEPLLLRAQRPNLGVLPGPGRVTHISHMQERVRQENLILLFGHHSQVLLAVAAHEGLPALSADLVQRDLKGGVLGDVCPHDGLDHELPQSSELRLWEVPKDVGALHAKDLKELAAVHVLQGRRVIVPDGQVVVCLHQEDIAEAGMPQVVGEGSCRQRKPLGG